MVGCVVEVVCVFFAVWWVAEDVVECFVGEWGLSAICDDLGVGVWSDVDCCSACYGT